MKPSEPELSDAGREHTEAIVARHVRALFERLPMLSGFFLRPNLEAEVSIFTWPGCSVAQELHEEIMRSLVALAQERPEAVRLIRGRTFARTLH
jgi:hypothetical protein